MKIKKYDTPHKQNERLKNHMTISIDAEKAIVKNLELIYDKNSQKSENRGIIPQHNKDHI